MELQTTAETLAALRLLITPHQNVDELQVPAGAFEADEMEDWEVEDWLMVFDEGSSAAESTQSWLIPYREPPPPHAHARESQLWLAEVGSVSWLLSAEQRSPSHVPMPVQGLRLSLQRLSAMRTDGCGRISGSLADARLADITPGAHWPVVLQADERPHNSFLEFVRAD